MTIRRLAIHHSFPGRAEEESAERVAAAARVLGIEARVVTGAAAIMGFDPDLVLCLSHHEGKVTHHPSVAVMMAPLGWFAGDEQAVERILGHDGFLTISASIRSWLADAGVPDSRVAEYTNTIGETGWVRPATPPRLAYVGTNWDGWRHWEVMRDLARHPYMRFFGPAASWSHVPPASYGGEVPFDGTSVIEVYRRAGIGLALDRPDFAADDLPSNRIFEIVASGAVALAPDIAFVRQAFGDSVLYLDPNAPARALAWQIDRHVRWVAANPERAKDMSRRAHEIFRDRYALERLLPNVLALHRQCRSSPRPPFVAATVPARTGVDLVIDITGRAVAAAPGASARAAALMDEGEIEVFLAPRHGGDEPPQGRVVLGPGEAVDFRHARHARIGDAWRITVPIVPAGRGLDVRISGLDRDVICVALRGRRAGPWVPMADAAAGRRVWVVGAGAGGRQVARSLHEGGHGVAAFLDDFHSGPVDGVPVLGVDEGARAIGRDDCVVLASQHWTGLWARLSGIPVPRLYTAHPGYGGMWLELPPTL